MNNYNEVSLGNQKVSFHNQAPAVIGEQDHSWKEGRDTHAGKNMDIAALKGGLANPNKNWGATMDAKASKALSGGGFPHMNLQQLKQI